MVLCMWDRLDTLLVLVAEQKDMLWGQGWLVAQGPVSTSAQGPVSTSAQGPVSTSAQGPVSTSAQGPVSTSAHLQVVYLQLFLAGSYSNFTQERGVKSLPAIHIFYACFTEQRLFYISRCWLLFLD